jgi:ribosomal protein S18 acetylase RimI-like enzyme
LNGRREPRDIIAAHQAHGRHEPDFWWLIRYAGEPAGVLIAAGIPGTTGYEIAYVGVVPQMRERGVARETMRRALAQMRVREASEVAITVDSRNQPALQLYASLGFEEFDCREVYLRL